MTPRFDLGQVVATPGAVAALSGEAPHFLLRHVHGDWGDVDESDRVANDQALESGGRLLSSYCVGHERLWVITEAVGDDGRRAVTTILLPAEY